MIEFTALMVGSSAGLAVATLGIALYSVGSLHRFTQLQKLHDTLKLRCASLRDQIDISEALERELEKAQRLTVEAEKKVEEAEQKLAEAIAKTVVKKKWTTVRYVSDLSPGQPLSTIHEQAEITLRALWDEDVMACVAPRTVRLVARHGKVPTQAEKHELLFEGQSLLEWQAYRKQCDRREYEKHANMDEVDDFVCHAIFHKV